MLAILDYKAGNQTSVRRAFDHLGIECRITAEPEVLLAAQGVIFPGVGAAGQAMRQLAATGMDAVLRRLVRENRPLLGVCLGCQILVEASEENNTKTLGVFPGVCKRLPSELEDEDGQPIHIPHMGWNSLDFRRDCPLFAGIKDHSDFFFVHCYYVHTDPDRVLAVARHGIEFCAAYGRDGLWAVQFHPEKSGRVGLQLLRNFADYCALRSGHA